MASADIEEMAPACTKSGIKASMLLSWSDSDTQHLPELDTVTNELVLELNKFKDRHRCTFKVFQKSCMAKNGQKEKHQLTRLLPEASNG